MNKKDPTLICTHYAENYNEYKKAIVPPIFQSTLHVFDEMNDYLNFDECRNEDEFVYMRVNNPTTSILEKKIAALEGGEAAICLGSGMAAISSAIMANITSNSHIIAVKSSYGPTYRFLTEYLKKFNVEVSFVEGDNIEEFQAAIKDNTQLIYLESPSSIVFKLQDLKAVAKIAKLKGIRTIIDNSWASPIFQKPIELGIDIVVHTVSKYLCGHSDVTAGVIVSEQGIISDIKNNERELFGGVLGPFESWLVIRGLRTLPIRLRQHEEAAMQITKFLETHSKVKKVYYPGLKSHPQYELGKRQMSGYGGLFSLELNTSLEGSKKFVDNLSLFNIGVSWGGYESLVMMPYAKYNKETAEYFNVSPSMIRIYTGLESLTALQDDIDQALTKI